MRPNELREEIIHPHVKHVEKHPREVADDEDDDDEDEHARDPLISSLPRGCPRVGQAGGSDDLEGETVEDDQEEEWYEGHDEKVCDEEIVPAVSVVVPERGGAELRVDDSVSGHVELCHCQG